MLYGIFVDSFEEYGDNNEGKQYGVEYYKENPRVNEDAETNDCEWFKSEEKRKKAMKLLDVQID